MLLKNNAKRIWRLKKVAPEIFSGRKWNFAKIAKKNISISGTGDMKSSLSVSRNKINKDVF